MHHGLSKTKKFKKVTEIIDNICQLYILLKSRSFSNSKRNPLANLVAAFSIIAFVFKGIVNTARCTTED